MGRRSRKRIAEGVPAPGGSSRAQRDEARRQRAEAAKSGGSTRTSHARGRRSIDDRPPPPWGNFPLSEIAVFVSIVLLIGSFIVRGDQGVVMFAAGLLLGTLAGLEVSIREHFAGFRSHSTLLAGSIAVISITAIALAAGEIFVPLLLAAGLAVFGLSFWTFREAFKRRSGGVSFR
jgi:hypothetical protein